MDRAQTQGWPRTPLIMKARHDAQSLLAKGVIHPFIGVFTDGRHLTECHGQKQLINHNILQVALSVCFYPMS